MTGQEKMGLTRRQMLRESILTNEMLLKGLRQELEQEMTCAEGACKQEADWQIGPYDCHPTRDTVSVCYDHVTSFLHQGADCTFTQVSRIR